MTQYHFKYGTGAVDIPLAENQVIEVLQGNEIPAIEDIGQALYASLDAPVDHAPLRQWVQKGDKVTLIVSDMSRFWMRQDLVVPHLIAYLNEECGVPDADMVIVVATGTHADGPESELRQLVTDDIFDRILVVNHNCQAEDLVYVGTTTRGTRVALNAYVGGQRKVIAVGAATQHVMAGYGGGRKSILPGVASMEAIKQNHLHSLDPLSARSNPLIGVGQLVQNPLHEDMCEAAAMVPHLFVVNLVMSPQMKLAYLFSGHWLHAWEPACRQADAMYEVPVKEQADAVIVSCGGYPKDMSLYQGSKVIDNVESCLKLGGTMILLMECSQGGGAAEYFNWLKPLRAGTLDAQLRKDFTIPGYIFYLNCEQAARYRIVMLSRICKKDVADMGIEAYDTVEELLEKAQLANKRIYVIPNGSTVITKLTQER